MARMREFLVLMGAAIALLIATPWASPAEKPAADAEADKREWLKKLADRQDLGTVVHRLYYGRVTEAYPLFYDVFHESRDPVLRATMLGLMAGRGMPRADKAILEALADGDRGVRLAAVKEIPTLKGDPAVPGALRRALAENDVEMRWMAARALAQIPTAFVSLGDEVRRLAADPDPLLRQALLANLVPGEGVPELAVPLLLEALAQRDPMTRMSAAEGLQRMGVFSPASKNRPAADVIGKTSKLFDALVADLAEPDMKTAGAAMYAVTALWHPELERRVRAALAADDLLLRVRAADVLRKRKAPFEPGVLLDAVKRGSEEVQLFVCGTLSRLQTEPCVPVLKAAMESSFPAVRQAAVYALETQPAAAVAALVGALGHADPNVRYRAAQVLGRRDATEALQRLEELARSDPDDSVRGAARIAAALVAHHDLAEVLANREVLLKQAVGGPGRKFDVAAGRPTVVRDGVVQVGTQKQLVVDDLVLENLGGATRRLHKFQKDPHNPVLEQQFPWERQGTLNFVSSVHYDPQARLFVCWYHSLLGPVGASRSESGRTPLIAYSLDGIQWLRPHVGLFAYGGSKANNVVGAASNIVPIPNSPDPNRRYASYKYSGQHNALAVAYSPDGISGWSEYKPVCGGGKDVVTACRDALGGGYFAFMKWRVGHWYRRSAWAAWGETPDRMTRGPINIVADLDDDRGSADRIARTLPGTDFFQPSRFHTEIYEVTPFIYEGFYFGLPVRFEVSGPGEGNVDGPTDLGLIASREKRGADGWLRPGGTAAWPVVDLGRWGEWDSTMHYGPNSVLVVDDQIVLYYTGACHSHEPEGRRSEERNNPAYRTAIGRATLRLDGLVSLAAGPQEAAVTTRPLVFHGDRLQVNGACPGGSLRVELLDSDGRAIAGFRGDQCDAFSGDALRHAVTWQGRGDLSALAGKTVRVRFLLKQGDLYAFQFVADKR